MTKIHSWFMGSLKSLGQCFHSSVAHTDCLLCSSQPVELKPAPLHCRCCSGQLPVGLTSLKCWCLLLQLDCTSPISSPGFSSGPHIVPNLVCSLWPLHAYRTSTALVILTLPSSAASEWPLIGHLWNTGCADPEEALLRFPFMGPVSSITADFVSPAKGHRLLQCRKLLLSNASLLLLPADSLALAYENRKCVVQNIRQPW